MEEAIKAHEQYLLNKITDKDQLENVLEYLSFKCGYHLQEVDYVVDTALDNLKKRLIELKQ